MAGSSTVHVVVHATDLMGRPLRSLGAGNFTTSVDGRTANLTSAERTTASDQPLGVVLVMDVSGSMRIGNAIGAARNAAVSFVSRFGANDRTALITFGSKVRRFGRYSNDKARVIRSIATVHAGDDRTLLYEALYDAAETAGSLPTGRSTVVALTDGQDTGSAVKLEDAARKAHQEGVAFYVLGFGPEADHAALRRLAELSGGRYFYAPRSSDLGRLYSEIWTELKDAYRLDVKLPPLWPGSHLLAVTLSYRGERATAIKEFTVPLPPYLKPQYFALGWLFLLVSAALVSAALLTVSRTQGTRDQQDNSRPRAGVEVVGGPARGRRARLVGPTLRIGSASGCHLAVPEDGGMAPNHAQIVARGSHQFLLKTRGAADSAYVNARAVPPGSVALLRPGDRIRIASTEMIFRRFPDAPATVPAWKTGGSAVGGWQ